MLSILFRYSKYIKHFCSVKLQQKTGIWLVVFLILSCLETKGQITSKQKVSDFVVGETDSLNVLTLNDIYVYPPQTFKNPAEEQQYLRLVRDVKKTLPYAKLVYNTLVETYEYIQTMPTEKEREEHLKRMEKDLYAEYVPVLKKMTLSQGKLLIKLVDRECNQSSYDIIKAFLGPFRAGFWNVFAGVFGASLKTTWDPEGKDAATERVVELVEMGVI